MAQLDYVFLADKAVVENGKLFVLGGSFTHVAVSQFPSQLPIAIAGRLRALVGEGPSDFVVAIDTAHGEFHLEFGGAIEDTEPIRPYGDGNVGRIFALQLSVPLMSPGLYTLTISLHGEVVRTLKFDAEPLA